MSSSLRSATSGEALPTPTSCSPSVAPNGLNVTGLAGQICQVNVPPDVINITSCCNNNAEVRLLNNCTQWCEADDGSDFFDCINNMAPSPYPFLGGPCRPLLSGSTPTISSTSTDVASTSSTSHETPESTEAPASTFESGDGPEATKVPDGEGTYPTP
jgi:hypothetical protein